MPNHVTTIVHADPHVLASFMRSLTATELEEIRTREEERRARLLARDGDERHFTPDERLTTENWRFVDFNLLIPMPEHDDPIFTATYTDYGSFGGWSMDGYSPLEWAREHWGTKWNAYDCVVDERAGRVEFDTAWSHPVPVIDALSRLHPEAEIRVEYADEDLGSNCGTYRIKNGELLSGGALVNHSPEAYELAAQIKYGKSYAEVQAEWADEEEEV